jgi:hypothetical protein
MKPRGWIFGGLALSAAAVVWHFAVSPIWVQRLPTGWSWQSNFIGITTYAKEDGSYPPDDLSNEYERVFDIANEENRPDSIELVQRFTTRDPDTGEVTWESSISTPVDPRSGAYAGEDFEGGIAVFPRFTAKKAYRLAVGYFKGLPMSFADEEELAGLAVYLFQYKGRGEYTESYLGTEDYEGITVEPGQEIKCNDDQYVVNIWVEPTTGEIVKWEESCYSGDAVYEIATGEKIYEISRWGGVSRGEETLRRAQDLRWQRLEILAMTRYLPILLLLLGAVALAAGFLSHRARKGAGAVT